MRDQKKTETEKTGEGEWVEAQTEGLTSDALDLRTPD